MSRRRKRQERRRQREANVTPPGPRFYNMLWSQFMCLGGSEVLHAGTPKSSETFCGLGGWDLENAVEPSEAVALFIDSHTPCYACSKRVSRIEGMPSASATNTSTFIADEYGNVHLPSDVSVRRTM